jgi:hypothetical protein
MEKTCPSCGKKVIISKISVRKDLNEVNKQVTFDEKLISKEKKSS